MSHKISPERNIEHNGPTIRVLHPIIIGKSKKILVKNKSGA